MKHIKGVMHLCKKFEIDECLNVCSAFMMENLTVEEMCLIYQLAVYYDDLKEFSCREIVVHTKKILQSEGFSECNWIVLNGIMKIDGLLYCELYLLEASISITESNNFLINSKLIEHFF